MIRLSLLLVEDNPDDIQLLKEMILDLESDLLNPVIINLSCASSLKEALDFNKDNFFDAVLLDLNLPDSSGIITLNSFLERKIDVPVLVLTGMDDTELAISSVKNGAQDYLIKDQISSTLLLRSIKYAMERFNAFKEKQKLINELENALFKIKTLSGMLPICASCKKIRDDKGYWNQIEEYIRDHSEAEFTHSICPKCAKDLYPDLDINEDE
jgi:DNA-binding NtrC family response regulator